MPRAVTTQNTLMNFVTRTRSFWDLPGTIPMVPWMPSLEYVTWKDGFAPLCPTRKGLLNLFWDPMMV